MRLFLVKRIKKIAVVCMALLLLWGIFMLGYAGSPIDDKGTVVTVNIRRGAGFMEIMDILDQAGVVKHKLLFTVLALSKGVAGHIKAGEYELTTSMTPADIADKLARGDIKIHRVTIPEDYTLKQIADLLEAEKLVVGTTFLNVTTDRGFLSSLKIQAPSAEGYLFPDTYHFNRAMTTREIVRIMVNRFWEKVPPQMVQRAKDLRLTVNEFVTLASLIGKESGYREEKGKISAVFHNRMKIGMKLQSDPTAIYSLHRYQNVVKRRHLDNKTPYNTYKIEGLPPGPIANPGLDSLQAALHPASVNYLYFVSNNDGTHQFSSNLSAHAQAVLMYKTKRKKE